MTRQFKLSRTFRSIKPHSTPNPNPNSKIELVNVSETAIESSIKNPSWCVYLIASTNPPFKTYVGVSTDFSRRLKQHNGELKGGAKASRAGRPWICACLVQGFKSQSEACEFESKWKIISRKLPRKQKSEDKEGLEDKGRLLLLQHRHAAMEKLKQSFDCDHLEVDWQLNPSL
ncbi:structure-specific endonuclease subunit slx1-like [Chenopodium quinoa]|uniref:structure-specific endonuclease subunit slx1-like n=1 Tax=Chenopodium quinoa TaxID=63459 RepID=UPI000B76EC27|nr:structure-specific endonuclease subunit slx1-like [Chenopodium quinoa]